MTTVSFAKVGLVVVATALVCGCANSGFDLSTASISPQQTVAKTDPVCTSLASQINSLKADGTIDKLEQAAEGKTSKVSIKRTALQKQAELNKAYAQFQTRCGPVVPNQVASQQTKAPAAAN
ncbi:hypothetical protein [Hyphomicrobium sp.]|jgi:hypothetical protein|uniref:hypothetical protein n=1 Tax=Hyphomicrobium sp. TaxID=82 RepID=UPI0035651A06